MYVLDTDHISLLDRMTTTPAPSSLAGRLSKIARAQIATTIITYEEQTRGWFSVLARARSVQEQVLAYGRLGHHLLNYKKIPVLPFDEVAAVQFQRLKSLKLKVASMDLKIAAIVLAQGGTLLTRNRADFAQIPGLSIDDWSKS